MAENNQSAAEQQIKLATAWQIRGQLTRAIANCEEALRLQPDYLVAYLTLISLLVKKGQREQAIAVYRQGVEKALEKAWNLPKKAQEEQLAEVQRRAENGAPPRILLYTNCPGTYGAEQISHALMVCLVQAGYEVICVQSRANHHLIDTRQSLGIEHIWLEDDAHKFIYATTNCAEVAGIFERIRPDLVIFADGNPLDNIAANWVALSLEIPYIRIVHCIILDWAQLYAPYLCLLPNIYQSATAVLSVSQVNLQQMRESFELPTGLGQVIYNGRPEAYFVPSHAQTRTRLRQELGIPQDAVVIFTSARIDEVKGYHHQIKAIEYLRQLPLWRQLYFVWAGRGSQETQIQEEIKELGVSDQVIFLGERADIPDLLAIADIFLLPSHSEGMPLAVMEAMAKGVPVMATAISGIPEELGDTGKLLPDPNLDPTATVAAIVETIQEWAIDADARQKIGYYCQKRAQEMFRDERMLESYLKLIQEAIRR
jgi:glycosyltransferase involved in cell wall biosynthesis